MPNDVEGALSVKVIVAVCPARSVGWLAAMATVGRTVLMASGGVSAAATLPLPAASVNAPAVTVTVPLTVELVNGVNRAE